MKKISLDKCLNVSGGFYIKKSFDTTTTPIDTTYSCIVAKDQNFTHVFFVQDTLYFEDSESKPTIIDYLQFSADCNLRLYPCLSKDSSLMSCELYTLEEPLNI